MPMRNDTTCSELEYLVMAMIASGISGGYSMRKQMDRMGGARWSTESGSIYRALKRLEESGRIEVSGRAGAPNRQRTEYQLTKMGQSELDHWMNSSIHPDELERLDDPVRSKAYYLDLVPEARREAVVKSWIMGTKNLIEGIKYDIERRQPTEPPMGMLALNGYLRLAEARLDWLNFVLKALKAR